MKNLHFCTPHKLEEIKSDRNLFSTIRTGWIPEIYPNDIIQINERTTIKAPHDDHKLCMAKCLSLQAVNYAWLTDSNRKKNYEEELDRYGKKFHPAHIFIIILFEKQKETQKTLD